MKQRRRSESAKLDRKIIERNRRIHMKGLCFKLASLIAKHHNASKDASSEGDKLDLDHAISYIKQLRERVEELKGRKQFTMSIKGINTDFRDTMKIEFTLPILELRDLGPNLEVLLVSGFDKNFLFYEVISLLEEEGAEVVNASFSCIGDKIFHTIHAQVTSSGVGMEISRVRERLKDLVLSMLSTSFIN
ncbi:PREDICTED: uncharacterized protein LOC104593222 [Nelumbo nucifera]|uniref:Uncharacterized protein LOC104593222 n=2 Tax=Nelumbo nucifera TaxID=4432 RepID=A0A1U7ZIE9_NELNU|nr:PREDICTED: uncharacterized protein LOC104593222 [Nelumbo nucifera]DAD34607.1 TPA_asm: hypothetical protein HUJ06_005247 [Nelumbo nucifera]